MGSDHLSVLKNPYGRIFLIIRTLPKEFLPNSSETLKWVKFKHSTQKLVRITIIEGSVLPGKTALEILEAGHWGPTRRHYGANLYRQRSKGLKILYLVAVRLRFQGLKRKPAPTTYDRQEILGLRGRLDVKNCLMHDILDDAIMGLLEHASYIVSNGMSPPDLFGLSEKVSLTVEIENYKALLGLKHANFDLKNRMRLITEYLVNISKRRAFWSLNEDILKINDSNNQYAISIKEDMARHFKTLSLDELRSPDFNLLSDQEYSEEEEAETMAETIEQYISKTRANYESGVVRHKFENKDSFEIKGQFLKELRTNTFSNSNHEDANKHIEKVLEIVDLFHIPNITIDQVMLRAFLISLTGAARRWLGNEPTGSITTWDGLKTKFLNKYYPPTRIAKKIEEINNFQQEPDENLYQAWEQFKELLTKCPQHYLTKMQEVILFYNGLGIPTRQIHDSIGAIPSKTAADVKIAIQEIVTPASVSVMPLSTHLNLGLGELVHTKLTVDLADRTVKYSKGIAENVLVGIDHYFLPALPKIDVYKRKITLRAREERIVFTSVKPASSLIKRVYMLSLTERMELDLEARLMGETLLRRNQDDDLMPTIDEGEVIEEFRTRNNELDTKINDYPSYCDYDKKIHIDCAHNLKFSCMIGFEFTHANFFPLLYVNVMSKEFHNSIMKDKTVYKGNNVIGALMNVPIFVGTFSVVTDFVVLENMDAYRDEGMGDVIFGESFLREAGIKARRLEGMITIYN
ncbi:reverse transcriptase domain-containing protein [Tanacetum coccineum]